MRKFSSLKETMKESSKKKKVTQTSHRGSLSLNLYRHPEISAGAVTVEPEQTAGTLQSDRGKPTYRSPIKSKWLDLKESTSVSSGHMVANLGEFWVKTNLNYK